MAKFLIEKAGADRYGLDANGNTLYETIGIGTCGDEERFAMKYWLRVCSVRTQTDSVNIF